ncbi:MAG: peptide chain release factor N(5)-glutamine methyltransferase [Candidatus Sericytochromatia bacterium]|nr:peptide chain release factor N(5)-glutamine methyltransferase [Candidatus Sericytochromatia bacterium]
MPTIGDALYQSSRQLLDAGVDTGSLEASLLLGRATGLDRLRLINRTADELPPQDWEAFQTLLARRLRREPLQYILGETEFLGLAFDVTPAVLIPRPDTETLVEAILDLEEERGAPTPITAADIGTGSGAIAVSLAKSLPYTRLVATDISPEALAVARSNAARHDVASQIDFRQGDGLAALDRPVRYLISNPPYIAEGEMAGLEPEVRDYEPIAALTPGPDPLRWYRLFAKEGAAWVEPDGWLALEVGAGQAEDVVALLAASGAWAPPVVKHDLAGISRVVLARRLA